MRRRKPKINRYSVEQLLGILTETPLEAAQKSPVFEYIKEHSFKVGETFIPNSVLFYMYLKSGKYPKLTRYKFFRFFGQFFKVKTLPFVKGYMLEGTLTYTEEDHTNARILTRKEKYEKKKPRKKTAKEDTKKEDIQNCGKEDEKK